MRSFLLSCFVEVPMQRDVKFQGSWIWWDAKTMGGGACSKQEDCNEPLPRLFERLPETCHPQYLDRWKDASHSSEGSHGAQGVWISPHGRHTAP